MFFFVNYLKNFRVTSHTLKLFRDTNERFHENLTIRIVCNESRVSTAQRAFYLRFLGVLVNSFVAGLLINTELSDEGEGKSGVVLLLQLLSLSTKIIKQAIYGFSSLNFLSS